MNITTEYKYYYGRFVVTIAPSGYDRTWVFVISDGHYTRTGAGYRTLEAAKEAANACVNAYLIGGGC